MILARTLRNFGSAFLLAKMVVFRIDRDNLTSGIRLRGNNVFVGFKCIAPSPHWPQLDWSLGAFLFFLYELISSVIYHINGVGIFACLSHLEYPFVSPHRISWLRWGFFFHPSYSKNSGFAPSWPSNSLSSRSNESSKNMIPAFTMPKAVMHL